MTLYPVQSNPDTQFIEALAAAAMAFTPPFEGTAIYGLPGLPNWGSRRYLIRGITYLAVEGVGLEFDFFRNAADPTNAIATDGFLARYQFASTNGVTYDGSGLYRYYIDGLKIPYFAEDTLGQNQPPLMYVGVQNCDTVAKSAAALGAIAVTIWAQPMSEIQG